MLKSHPRRMAATLAMLIAAACLLPSRPVFSGGPTLSSRPAQTPRGQTPQGQTAESQPQNSEVTLKDAPASVYANWVRASCNQPQKEVFLDFGITRGGAEPAMGGPTLVVSVYTARRLESALQLALQRHEQFFGAITVPPQQARRAAGPQPVIQYANYCRVSSTPEEVILDCALNPRPFVAESVTIVASHQIVLQQSTAKALYLALSAQLADYERNYGPIETDVRNRVVK